MPTRPAHIEPSIELPPEVVEGWEWLAEQSSTYRAVTQTTSTDPKAKPQPPDIWTRLDDRYAKNELMRRGATDFESLESVESVFLFDSRDYLYIGRDGDTKKLRLMRVGVDPLYLSHIHTGKPRGPAAGDLRLLDAAQGVSNDRFIKFAPASADVPHAVLVGEINHPQATEPWQVEVHLDPQNHYRPIRSIRPPDGRRRTVSEISYGDHPARPIRTEKFFEVRDESNNWRRSLAETIEYTFLPTDDLSAKHFSLEYYELPPFRPKTTPWWLYSTVAIGSVTIVSIGAVLWRRRRR